MEQKETKEFYAFISYKREDERWARWLQHRLEHYRLPANLNGRTDLPKEIRPIFRDTSELLPGNLPQQINDALAASHHLIVICSPHSAQSVWVNKEIETFIAMGKQANIIPFIVDGHPFAQNPDEECFPVAIRNLPSEQELLGANVAEMGREAAAVKTVARMFGIRFDTLWGRYQREQHRRRNWIIAAVAVFVLAILGVAGYIWKQNDDFRHAISRAAAKEAMQLIEQGDGYTAQRVALAALDKAYTPEAEAALRQATQCRSGVLRGHTAYIRSMDFSPDRKHLLTTSWDSTIRIWDISNGACVQNIKELAYIARFSTDGQYFVSTSDSSIHIWDAATGKCVQTIEGHHRLSHPVFSPDGKSIATALSDTSLCLWERNSGKCIRIFESRPESERWNKDNIRMTNFSPDGKYIVMAADHYVFLWNVSTGECLLTEADHSLVDFADFTPDSKHIITCGETIRIWDAFTGNCIREIEGMGTAALNLDRNLITAHDNKGTINIWDITSGERIRTLEISENEIVGFNLAFCPDNKHIAVPLSDFSIYLWELNDQKDSYTIDLKRPTGWIKNLSYSTDRSKVATISSENDICVWNVSNGECSQVLKGHPGAPMFATFSPDGDKMISTALDKTARIWYIPTSKCLNTLQLEWGGCVTDADFSPTGQYVATAYRDSLIRIWDAVTGQSLQTFHGHRGCISSIRFSPNGKWLASGSTDATIRIWDMETGNLVKVLDKHTSIINTLNFSTDGKHLISSSFDNSICIWDIATWRCTHVLKGHTNRIYYTAFSPNGKHAISAASDKTIRIWDVITGDCIYMYKLEEYATGVTFSADGKSFFYGKVLEPEYNEYGDMQKPPSTYTIYVHDFLPLEELKEQVRSRFKDNPLTPEERRQYYLE